MPSSELSLAEYVCLTLIHQQPRHGWSLTKELGANGELGAIWTLSRPLTYRAIDQLESKGMVTRGCPEAGAGPSRVTLRATAAGRRRAAAWLHEPVEHLRDLRTEFLLKATLLGRTGDDLLVFIDAQEAALAPVIDQLVREGGGTVVDSWRRESARAAQRFFHRLRSDLNGRGGVGEIKPLRLSARNQLRATVGALHDGDLLCTVTAVLPDGQRVTATITREGARELDLAVDDEVLVIIKATEVMIAKMTMPPGPSVRWRRVWARSPRRS